MGEIIIGVIAIAAGLLFCFRGNLAMRLIFPFIGFFVGLSFGAGLVTAITGDGFFSTLFSWVVGIFFGLIAGALAYFFFEVAVAITFAGFGFALTAALLAGLGLDWNWLIILAGTVVGLMFAVATIAYNLPILYLVIATAIFGAGLAVRGLLLALNINQLEDFNSAEVLESTRAAWAWFIVWAVLAIGGIVSQMQALGREARSMRDYWNA